MRQIEMAVDREEDKEVRCPEELVVDDEVGAGKK